MSNNDDDKENPNAAEDSKEGLNGNDQQGIFTGRKKGNEDGLKKRAELDEEKKIEEEKEPAKKAPDAD